MYQFKNNRLTEEVLKPPSTPAPGYTSGLFISTNVSSSKMHRMRKCDTALDSGLIEVRCHQAQTSIPEAFHVNLNKKPRTSSNITQKSLKFHLND